MASADDRKAALAVLEQAQFVFGLSRYPKKQVLDDPRDVKQLRERLEAMREAAKKLSAAEREKLKVPWDALERLDTGTEAIWTAAKKVTPKLIAELTPLVRDAPEAAFLISPATRGAGRKAAGTREAEEKTGPPRERVVPPPRPRTGLTGSEVSGLQMAVQDRVTAEDAFFSWLQRSDELPLAEWRTRFAAVEKARRAEDAYLGKLIKARSRER